MLFVTHRVPGRRETPFSPGIIGYLFGGRHPRAEGDPHRIRITELLVFDNPSPHDPVKKDLVMLESFARCLHQHPLVQQDGIPFTGTEHITQLELFELQQLTDPVQVVDQLVASVMDPAPRNG
jgi:hypothetical protein